MIGITNGLGTIYTADADRPVCNFILPQEIIISEEETIILISEECT
jgi:hypothetical protein